MKNTKDKKEYKKYKTYTKDILKKYFKKNKQNIRAGDGC